MVLYLQKVFQVYIPGKHLPIGSITSSGSARDSNWTIEITGSDVTYAMRKYNDSENPYNVAVGTLHKIRIETLLNGQDVV